MKRRDCTCAGPAPGYPQHEDWCGQEEPDDAPVVHKVSASAGRGERWVARCTCQWWQPATGKEDASQRMWEHKQLTDALALSPHTCYFAEEFESEHCVACKLEPLTKARAA